MLLAFFGHSKQFDQIISKTGIVMCRMVQYMTAWFSQRSSNKRTLSLSFFLFFFAFNSTSLFLSFFLSSFLLPSEEAIIFALHCCYCYRSVRFVVPNRIHDLQYIHFATTTFPAKPSSDIINALSNPVAGCLSDFPWRPHSLVVVTVYSAHRKRREIRPLPQHYAVSGLYLPSHPWVLHNHKTNQPTNQPNHGLRALGFGRYGPLDPIKDLPIRSYSCYLYAYSYWEVYFQYVSALFLRCWLLSGNNGSLIVLDFLLLSLVTLSLTGAYIYLPDHAKSVYDHLYYYFVGERAFIASRIPLVSSGLEGGTQTLEDMYETARAAATTIMRRIAWVGWVYVVCLYIFLSICCGYAAFSWCIALHCSYELKEPDWRYHTRFGTLLHTYIHTFYCTDCIVQFPRTYATSVLCAGAVGLGR